MFTKFVVATTATLLALTPLALSSTASASEAATAHTVVDAKKKPKPKKPKGAIPFTAPTPPAAIPYTPGQLVFAQFNVCKTQCAAPAPDWDTRRPRVERVLASTGADVIGVNEATNYSTSTARTQWIDIQQFMADDGYVAPKTTVDECERPRDANGQLAGASPCEHTTGILYKTATVKEIDTPAGSPSSGATMVRSIAPGVNAESGIREVNWAFLQARDESTPPFLAVSMHLSTVKDADYENSRVLAAQGLSGWASQMITNAGLPANTPVVLMADLNSYQKRQPNGAQKVLTDTGWVDTYTAPKIINERWSTVNETPTTSPWSGKPYFYYSRKNPVTRIDYIFGRNVTPVVYENVMWLTSDGSYIPEYQASDHNAVRAVLKF